MKKEDTKAWKIALLLRECVENCNHVDDLDVVILQSSALIAAKYLEKKAEDLELLTGSFTEKVATGKQDSASVIGSLYDVLK